MAVEVWGVVIGSHRLTSDSKAQDLEAGKQAGATPMLVNPLDSTVEEGKRLPLRQTLDVRVMS